MKIAITLKKAAGYFLEEQLEGEITKIRGYLDAGVSLPKDLREFGIKYFTCLFK